MECYIQKQIGQTKIATINDGEMTQFNVELDTKKSMVGAVYVGRVIEVNKAQSMAVLDLGETNAILNNFNKLSEGQTLLVQVIRDGWSDKFPAVHTRINMENRHFKISSNGKGYGFDKSAGNGKIKAELEKIALTVVGEDNGVVVKTVAVNEDQQDLQKSYDQLRSQHSELLKTKLGKVGLVKSAPSIIENAVLNCDYNTVFATDCVETLTTLKALKKIAPDIVVKQFKDGDLFESSGINETIDELLNRTVDISGGGNIVIDEVEAITAIDVNASDLKTLNKGDEAIFKLNKRAIKTIAQQIVLRNLSGLIVIDFVRLKNRGMAKQLPKLLKSELQRIDKNTFDVMDITKAGLVEMTRKRTNPSISEIYLQKNNKTDKKSTIIGLELLQDVIKLNGAGKPTIYAPKSVIDEFKKGELVEMVKHCEERLKKGIEFVVDENTGVELKK